MKKLYGFSTGILLFISVICVWIFLYNLYSCACFFNDDWDTIITCENNLYKNPANGIYLASILERFFGVFLCLKFNIHPNDFKMYYFSLIAPLFLVYGVFCISFLLNKKNNILLPLSFVAVFVLVLNFITLDFSVLFIYDGLFRMILPVFLMINLLLLLLADIDAPCLSKKIFVFIFTFISAVSNELTFFIIAVAFILYILPGINTFKILPSVKNNFSLIAMLRKHIFGIFTGIAIVLAFVVMIKSGVFLRKAEYYSYPENLTDIIKTIKIFLPEFLSVFVESYIRPCLWMYILFIAQILFLLFTQKNNDKKNKSLKLVLSFLAGFLLFFISLIIPGKTYITNLLWLQHSTLNGIYFIIFLSLIFAAGGIILKYYNTAKAPVAGLLLIPVFFLINPVYSSYQNYRQNVLIFVRNETYKAEKEIRLAMLQNRNAVLDVTMKNGGLFWAFDNSSGENYVTPFSLALYNLYMLRNHRFEKIPTYTFAENIDAAQDFKVNGGVFTDEEMNNICFTKLYDDNFVLNK